MIEFIKIGFDYDPVQAVFHKSRSQDDIELSNQFPYTIRIERNQLLPIPCELVLTHPLGYKWPVITGLTPIIKWPGYYVGNKLTRLSGKKKETSMVVINTEAIKGKMTVYLFPDHDYKGIGARYKAAVHFINFVCEKVGQL